MLRLVKLVRIKAQVNHSEHLIQYSKSHRANDPLGVSRRGRFFEIQCDGKSVARLDRKISDTLFKLDQGYKTRFQAYLSRRRRELELGYLNSGKSLTVEINIYSRESDSAEVGSMLSQSEDYLQAPRCKLDGIKYMNPHILHINGFPTDFEPLSLDSADDDSDDDIRSNENDGDEQEEDIERTNESNESHAMTNSTREIYQLLDSDQRQGLSNTTAIDGRIKSHLLE